MLIKHLPTHVPVFLQLLEYKHCAIYQREPVPMENSRPSTQRSESGKLTQYGQDTSGDRGEREAGSGRQGWQQRKGEAEGWLAK